MDVSIPRAAIPFLTALTTALLTMAALTTAILSLAILTMAVVLPWAILTTTILTMAAGGGRQAGARVLRGPREPHRRHPGE